MKKILFIVLSVILFSSCSAYAAKYKVNTSGVVKTNGKVVSPSKSNPYNVYNANDYVNTNKVNSVSVNTIELVMDYSGSMSSWISQAKKVMANIIAQIPSSVSIGFRVFGHDNHGQNLNNNNTIKSVKKIVKNNGKYSVQTENEEYIGCMTGYCSATAQVAQIMKNNTNNILSGMNSVDIGGATPLVYALERTVNQDFVGLDRVYPKKIVLITDGGENCGGDPCEFAKKLMQQRNDVHIDVVLVSGFFSKLSCLAGITGGKMYRVNNFSKLSNVLVESMTSAPEKVDVPVQEYEFYGNY